MVEQEHYKNCRQSHDCHKAYELIGKTRGPSVTPKVVTALLIPLLIFIITMVAFNKALAKVIETKELQGFFSFLLALVITFVCVSMERIIHKLLKKG